MEPVPEVNETPAVDLGPLLRDRDSAMVTLVAGDTSLVAHRAVLAARSPVFATMLRDNTLEATSCQVEVLDVEGSVLRLLLEYLYTLQAPHLPDMVPQLLVAADTYGLPGLKAECEQQVAAQLSVETAAAAAVLAVRHSCAGLTQAAVAFIKANLVAVMATQGWANAMRTQPDDLIEVSRLVSELPAETSAPAAADRGSSSRPGAQPHGDHDSCEAPASSTPPAADAAAPHVGSLSRDEQGRRLIKAAKAGAMEELQNLLALGVNAGASDGIKWTALHHAAASGHVEAVRRLVGGGAQVDARNTWQGTPLHLAAYYGQAAVVRLLVEEASADPNARNQWGWTPLHDAAYNGHTEAVAALLAAGADREAMNDDGLTPWDIAKQNNHQQLADLLR